MSKEKQILQMLQDGYSQRRISSTLLVSRNTVARVVKAASVHGLSKDALESMEETELHHMLFHAEANVFLDVRVKVIYDGQKGDIINQYVAPEKVYNERIKLHGKSS
ncbi:MAG: helix-turn-helix domain-containing protein [Eubacteriales bacterium]|nr:helix-turn-helix domain-containing protein [Eubacteriales bacterium]